jgi:Domain of unknown function (DUF4432)
MADYFEQVLTDGWRNTHLEQYRLTSENFPGYVGPAWKIKRMTLVGGKQHGVDLIAIHNGHMQVVVVPTRGMSVLEASTEDLRLGWDSPVRQVVHPMYMDVESLGGIGFLRGFNELVCRCGLSSHGAPSPDAVRNNNGDMVEVTLPLHGTICNTPAVRVVVRVQLKPPYELSVMGEVCDTQMFGAAWRLLTTVSTVPGSNEFTVSDTIENMCDTPSEMELLYHCNYGPPMLGEGAQFVAPVKFCCPRDAGAATGMDRWELYGAPEPGRTEQCYLLRMHGDAQNRTVTALIAADEKHATSIRYSLDQLPAFTLWKNTAGEADGYVTGLEPGTDYPNPRAFEREKGRVLSLPPGGIYEAELTYAIVNGADAVAELKGEIAALAERKDRTISSTPDPEYSPV